MFLQEANHRPHVYIIALAVRILFKHYQKERALLHRACFLFSCACWGELVVLACSHGVHGVRAAVQAAGLGRRAEAGGAAVEGAGQDRAQEAGDRAGRRLLPRSAHLHLLCPALRHILAGLREHVVGDEERPTCIYGSPQYGVRDGPAEDRIGGRERCR